MTYTVLSDSGLKLVMEQIKKILNPRFIFVYNIAKNKEINESFIF